MKVIIPLVGFGTRMRPHTWSRAKPLLNVAGNTIVGHWLNLMSEITMEEVVFVVGYKGDEIEAWIRQNYPHLDAHFVVQEESSSQGRLSQADTIRLCRDYLDDRAVLVVGQRVALGRSVEFGNDLHPVADFQLAQAAGDHLFLSVVDRGIR